MRRCALLAACLVIVSACSTPSSNVLPPVPLPEIKDPIRVLTLWKRSLGFGVYNNYLKLRPYFHQQVGYGVDYYGLVMAFNPMTGETIWQTNLDLPLSTGPVIIDGRLYTGSSQGNLVALDPKDGHELWRTQVSSEILAPPAGEEGIIVVRSVDGRVTGLDGATGKRRWVVDTPVPLLSLRGTSAPVISEGIVLVGSDSGKLFAMTLIDGTVLWEVQIAEATGRSELERMIDIDATPVVVDGVIYVVTYQGRLVTVQMETGRILWARDISSYTGMTVDKSLVYLSDSESRIWALNRFNGATLWRQDKLLRRSVTAPILKNDYLVVGDYNGYVHWIEKQDGKLVARKRVEAGYYLFNSEAKELDKIFPKDNNILVAPLAEDNLIVAVDRLGNIRGYKLSPLPDEPMF
ncbi:MAG: outer membrane protein assembly factor BamB [Proteobacteria bacterium]|nr:outer membrane protein assembly factor BamB [Pseudomonadota bacterium]